LLLFFRKEDSSFLKERSKELFYYKPAVTGNCSPRSSGRPGYPDRMIGTPASAARGESRAVRPCNRPVAMTLAAAA
jgi:hypothetical protein